MPSIFDPPAGARTFNAADWLAAIDVQIQTPPSRPPIDEAEQIADEPLATWDTEPATQPAATRRRVRNWPIAVAAWLVIAGFIGAVGYPIDGWTLPLLIGLAVMTLELLLWLILAWRFGKL
jgi:hypothetical protein